MKSRSSRQTVGKDMQADAVAPVQQAGGRERCDRPTFERQGRDACRRNIKRRKACARKVIAFRVHRLDTTRKKSCGVNQMG